MKNTRQFINAGFLLAWIGLAAGCVVAPGEGYYDRDHHRYYHEHGWHDCGDHDDHCH
jgi:hypothetical protein